MSLHNVRLYSIPNCSYCSRAKSLLNRLAIPFTEVHCVDASDLPTGLTTFPQIYFGLELVGGCDDLFNLYREGKLQ